MNPVVHKFVNTGGCFAGDTRHVEWQRQATSLLTFHLNPHNIRGMQFGMWDTLFNLVLLLFWTRIWATDRHDMLGNPYLVPIGRIQRSAVNFLHPLLPFLPGYLIAAIALVFLTVFRGVAVPRDVIWELRIGFTVARADGNSMLACVIFSALSFALFLFRLWGISLIYVRTRRSASFVNTSDALCQLGSPFTDLQVRIRPLVLLAVGVLLAYLLTVVGEVPERATVYETATTPLLAARLLLVSLSGWVALLPVVQSCLILMIIGSWVSMLTGSHGLASFCREWIDLLIGPMRRFPLRIGMLDLTPLVFMFALGFVHVLLQSILLHSFLKLAGT